MSVLARFAVLFVFLGLVASAASAQTINCSSEDSKHHCCNADTRWGIELERRGCLSIPAEFRVA